MFLELLSLFVTVGKCSKSRCGTAASGFEIVSQTPKTANFLEKFPVCREIAQETGAITTASPANQSGVRPGSPRNARMGRKSRLFAHSIPSPGSQFAELKVEIAESLRPCPRIFPFCRDYWRRLV